MIIEPPQEYERLSEEEKNRLTNGCGPEIHGLYYSLSKTFDLACRIHDIQYGLEASRKKGASRKKADEIFLKNMLKIADEKPFFQRLYYKAKAYVFYWFVRKYGESFYAQKPKGKDLKHG